MTKKIAILVVIALVLIGLIMTAGNLVLNGSPGLALLPVSIVLIAAFVYIKNYSE
ncbi:hypothetical protein [Glaciecola petra]|uniref:DUF3098 domain-containing protein n=1 Tax=Glaciecola petra TaxID=3075602 RepID=A0ABU2ZQ43_9ALTE|nr:hypothetical protein [Aestuariibacter sp. P117]MDT0594750.1 hypothetical protein [Aestuariibacter sp. P117]